MDYHKIAIFSGFISSGQIGWPHLASGAIRTHHLSSGATINRSQFVSPFVSGTAWTATTEETISGVRAVALSQSGRLRIAMASIANRMPAVGVVVDNVNSGQLADVYTIGTFQFSSGLTNFSGYIGQLLFVGRSGHIVTTSGFNNATGFQSGDILQAAGTTINSGGATISLAANLPFITVRDIVSGSFISYSRNVADTFMTEELISGVKPVCLTSDGKIAVAQGSSGLRMPAIGVVGINIQSGGSANVTMMGIVPLPSPLDIAISGQVGRPVYVSMSGDFMTVTRPTISGVIQRIGVAMSGAVLVTPHWGLLGSGGY